LSLRSADHERIFILRDPMEVAICNGIHYIDGMKARASARGSIVVRARPPGRPGSEASLLAIGVLKQFRVIYGSVRHHFRQVEDACGVSGSQLWLLHEVGQQPGIGVSELAHRLSIHQTTCSQLVEKLASHGYLRKTRSTEDQRRVGLTLTPAASRVLRAAPGPAEGLLPEALMKLPQKRLRSLTGDLGALIGELRVPDPLSAERPLSEL
jgi:DNA-binding MarR family transcriptional regulator